MYCSPMADNRRYLPNQQLELAQILQEAKHRWLRPTEICEILRNYQKFQLTPDPPVTPPAGSLFLFDRKALRYFRKDGHRWRKKKDGKTVKEAHEKLKAGSVDALHCYYAHGEDNENFQRRSYWMLDGQLEHIVLVHYREVKEGYKSGVSRLLADPGSQVGSSNKTSTQAYSPSLTVQTSYTPTLNQADWNGQRLSSEIKNRDLCGDQGTSLHQSPFGSLLDEASPLSHGVSGFPELSSNNLSGSWYAGPKFFSAAGSTHWDGVTNEGSILKQTYRAEHANVAGFITHKLTDSQLDMDSRIQGVISSEDRLTTDNDIQAVTTDSQREIQHNSLTPSGGISTDQGENKSKDTDVLNEEVGELKKLDSFGRWMDKEIGLDCDDSLMASDSTNYWNSLDTDKEVSSLSRHMQLDIDSLGPSLSQEQLFSIYDFSPDWAYSGLATKVLVIGKFLGSKTHSTETKWGCMFGEIEVSAEVLTDNVIRCQTPSHDPGHVPFYVTCSNRLACSEVREFDYREMPMELAIRNRPEDELCIQIRLGKLLTIGPERQWLDCSVLDCQKCALRSTIYSMRSNDGNREWGILEEKLASENDNVTPRDVLIQNLLKDRLFEWLVCRVHEAEGGRGPNVLDDEGQGVIHLAAALGYEWAMDPIIAAGVGPNFRDKRGRTGLHWASYFGREETVVALVKLGAAPGAVDDPTPAFPGGQTAADLASNQGHKGIAGYLAEAYLTSHLSLLDINENVIESVATSYVAENLLETEANVSMSDFPVEQHSLKGSLAAVRNSVRAAALIQADFRNRSFRLREITKSNDDVDVASVDLVALGSLNRVPKMSHFDDYLHSAAVSIQRKYRGWKGRREFLKIRNRIVKIQAHVRGHQVRNKYRKVVWSVSILEKVILRWRRKGVGLRGFRVEKAIEDVSPETQKGDEYEFLRVGRKQKSAGVVKALEKVKSMVRHPEAREQYMRLVSKSQEMGHEEKHGSKQVNNLQ